VDKIGEQYFCRAKNGSEWRIATGEWFFLEGSAPALPKIFGTSGDAPSRIFRYTPLRLHSCWLTPQGLTSILV
jgi:hypothetical protein